MKPETESTLTSRLRAVIARDHDAIEKTDFSVALMSGSLKRETYAMQMAQMYYVHHVMETVATEKESLGRYFEAGMCRAEVIDRDLGALGLPREMFSVLPETKLTCELLEQSAEANSLSLIGAIYVLEGSRMGSLVLAKPLAGCLGISGAPGSGIDYHVDGAREVPMRLKQWKGAVDQSAFEAATQTAIETLADEFMHHLLDLYAAIPVPELRGKNAA